MYFHGTSPLAAVSIATDGFRLIDVDFRNYGDGAIGPGIYLGTGVWMAVQFATQHHVVLLVDLAPGVRVLRLDGTFDDRVIGSLRREFGVDILEANFARAIPANKRLEHRELIHLLNYLWTRNEYGGKLGLWAADLTRDTRRFLKRYHYDGFGDPRPHGVGTVIFNPSLLSLRSIVIADATGEHHVPADPAELAGWAGRQLITTRDRAGRRWGPSTADRHAERRYIEARRLEMARLCACLRRFCTERSVPIDSETESALDAMGQ